MGKNRIGEQFKTNEGYEIVIVKYNGCKNVSVEFQDEYKAVVNNLIYSNIKKGEVKNPYHPSVYGIGYFGVGDYKSRDEQGNITKAYHDWIHMIKRGYDEELKNKYPTYKDVIVYKGWHNFQNFAEWWYNNYYEIEGEQMNLDKDILYKGNKIYSPDTCIFVPKRINTLFCKSDTSRGSLPIGVYYHKARGKYCSQCNILVDNNDTKRKYLGIYNTPEQAFLVYKRFKEAYIKEVADKYKDIIPKELYDAMCNWIIEIDD